MPNFTTPLAEKNGEKFHFRTSAGYLLWYIAKKVYVVFFGPYLCLSLFGKHLAPYRIGKHTKPQNRAKRHQKDTKKHRIYYILGVFLAYFACGAISYSVGGHAFRNSLSFFLFSLSLSISLYLSFFFFSFFLFSLSLSIPLLEVTGLLSGLLLPGMVVIALDDTCMAARSVCWK